VVKYEVWDPAGIVDPVSFVDEKKADTYRARMEKSGKRIFRTRKIFEPGDGENKVIVPGENDYIRVTINALPGDLIRSKKGILTQSSMTGKTYRVKSFVILNNGGFEAREKEEIK